MKRVLSVFLALVMALSLITVVPVTAEEPADKIQSLTFQPVELIYQQNGYDVTNNSGNAGWYYYSPSLRFTAEVAGDDGTETYEDVSYLYLDGEYYYPDFDWDAFLSQNQYQLRVGRPYTLNVSVAGYQTTVSVTVIQTPIKSMVFEPVTLVAGCGGSEATDGKGNTYYHYDIDCPNATVTFRDGTTGTFNGSYLYWNGNYYYANNKADDQQRTTHFVVRSNPYTVSVEILGYKGSYKVSVISSPIERIEFDEYSIIEKTGGSMTGSAEDTYYRYNVTVPPFTAYFSDGTSYSARTPVGAPVSTIRAARTILRIMTPPLFSRPPTLPQATPTGSPSRWRATPPPFRSTSRRRPWTASSSTTLWS